MRTSEGWIEHTPELREGLVKAEGLVEGGGRIRGGWRGGGGMGNTEEERYVRVVGQAVGRGDKIG